MEKNKIVGFNDKWARIIGIPLISIIMPVLFSDEFIWADFFKWFLVSFVITFFSWTFCRKIVIFIWNKYPWHKKALQHLIAEIILLSTVGFLVVFLLFVGNLWVNNGNEDMQGAYISSFIIVFFITGTHEAFFLFLNWKKSLIEKEKLEKEYLRSEYNALKNQINPHFLFNNLSVLSSLCYPNPQPEKSKEFIDEFSNIYRYILDMNQKTVIVLKEELCFLKSYTFLMKIRFKNAFEIKYNINKSYLNKVIPPLTVQLLLENAIKHNRVSKENPLKIDIFTENNFLIVKNNLQLRKQDVESKKIGLKNLEQKYEFISNKKPKFFIENDVYVAKIPLLDDE